MKRIIFLFSILYFLLLGLAFATSPTELREAIDQKSKELEDINSQIEEARKSLIEVEKKGKTLNQEIKGINYNLKQLNLSIRSSEINIEKTNLELSGLDYEINDQEKRISLKKEAVVKFLQAFQDKDTESALMIFLRSKSLAQSLSEFQAISDFSNGLSSEISELEKLKNELIEKFKQVASKKRQIEKENNNLKYKKSISEDQKKEIQNLLKLNSQQEKIYQKKVEELEKQQAAIIEEIEKAEEELRKQIDPTALPAARPGVLGKPMDVDIKKYLTQSYGETAFAKQSKSYSENFHNGIDVGAFVGTPVLAVEDGEVLAIGNTDKYCPSVWYGRKRFAGSYGKYIVVKHNNNLSTLYAHLSRQVVQIGDIVKRGDIIGYSGNTGRSTGPHLHFTVYANIYSTGNKLISPEIRESRTCGPQPYGASLNPLGYLQY